MKLMFVATHENFETLLGLHIQREAKQGQKIYARRKKERGGKIRGRLQKKLGNLYSSSQMWNNLQIRNKDFFLF